MNPFTFNVTENEPMSRHTTLRVGGPAQYFFVGRSVSDISRAVIEAVAKKIQYAFLGGGSNTLVADNGFNGLIIQIAMTRVEVKDHNLRVEAGAPSVLAARKAAEHGFSGIEWMVTLPGSVGGAVYGNAGAFGSETKDRITSVEAVDDHGEIQIFKKSDCAFAYRNSIFKKRKPELVVLAATFSLELGDTKTITAHMNEFLAKRKDEQPLGASSAGCMFKNVEVKSGEADRYLAILPDEAHNFVRRGRIPAGWLIQKAGLKNFSVGKATVSDRHANFCLNLGGATASDIKTLSERIQDRVASVFSIHLEPEVQFLGF